MADHGRHPAWLRSRPMGADAGAVPPSAPEAPWWRRRGDLLAVLALIVASFVFTTEQVAEHDMMSPIDEYQYVGYYAKVADHGIVRRGEAMPFFARKYMVCNGVRNIPEMPPNPRPAQAEQRRLPDRGRHHRRPLHTVVLRRDARARPA